MPGLQGTAREEFEHRVATLEPLCPRRHDEVAVRGQQRLDLLDVRRLPGLHEPVDDLPDVILTSLLAQLALAWFGQPLRGRLARPLQRAVDRGRALLER